MLGKSHGIIGFAAFLGATTVMHQFGYDMTLPEAAIGATACVFGSLLPDIDHHSSSITKSDYIMGGLSKVVCMFTSHRQHTHTLLFAILAGFLMYTLARIAIPLMGSSIPFFIAFVVFLLVHLEPGRQQWAGVFGIAVFLAMPFILPHIPFNIPTVNVPVSFAKTIGFFTALGTASHIFPADMLCKEGAPLAWPIIRPVTKHQRIGHLTTGSTAENIIATAVSIVDAVWLILLIQSGVIDVLSIIPK